MNPSRLSLCRRCVNFAWLCCAVGLVGCMLGGCAQVPAGNSLLDGALLERTAAAGEAVLEVPVPSHERLWRIEQAVLPYVEWDQRRVTVRNVRQCRWRSEESKEVRHADWQFAWGDVQGVDFVVAPFRDMPLLAHTMLSFRLADGRCLGLSVEARLERGETYSVVAGAARQFELMYVLADEPDLYGLRAEVRRDDLYLYETRATGAAAARLLRDVLQRVDQLVAEPEFYDSLSNNCTTNLVQHLNRTQLGQVPADWRSQLPGQSDRLAHSLGLLKTTLPFEEARRQAWVSSRVRQHLGAPEFSQKIRQSSNAAIASAAGR
ncbi:lipoprotein N-acyltransferase Lnb domain-containing protein [Candidatus Laterigemmans baculatus]|uniref:lipoprotein N-acyltransferase Lnb domain-containing protein n=1 Tax=Candidatus Laterigemmans baculatus TaxID=2770505 RepID=UPI0013DB8CCE|nr:DUF4105 domain-containing protein [Candidatus Laterigemmans baculatus]